MHQGQSREKRKVYDLDFLEPEATRTGRLEHDLGVGLCGGMVILGFMLGAVVPSLIARRMGIGRRSMQGNWVKVIF